MRRFLFPILVAMIVGPFAHARDYQREVVNCKFDSTHENLYTNKTAGFRSVRRTAFRCI